MGMPNAANTVSSVFLLTILSCAVVGSCTYDFEVPAREDGVDAGADGSGGTTGLDGDTESGDSTGTGGSTADAGDAEVGGAGGSAGFGGTGPHPIDCVQACPGYCADPPSSPSAACATCLADVCSVHLQAADDAQGMTDYLACIETCPDPQCEDTCCLVYTQACRATSTARRCSCGYLQYDCSALCPNACDGAIFETPCKSCLWQSPCAISYYEYTFAQGSQGLSDCLTVCDGDPTCFDVCCAANPSTCQERSDVVDCLCN